MTIPAGIKCGRFICDERLTTKGYYRTDKPEDGRWYCRWCAADLDARHGPIMLLGSIPPEELAAALAPKEKA